MEIPRETADILLRAVTSLPQSMFFNEYIEDKTKLLRYKTSNEFEKEISSGAVIVDFFAEWCGPCKMLAPIFEELSVDMEGKVKFLKIDVDKNLEIANKYNVVNIVTMIIIKEGEEQKVITGFLPKKSIEENIKKFIEGED